MLLNKLIYIILDEINTLNYGKYYVWVQLECSICKYFFIFLMIKRSNHFNFFFTILLNVKHGYEQHKNVGSYTW